MSNEGEAFLPSPRIGLRLVVWLLVVVFLLIGNGPWIGKLVMTAFFAAVVGITPWATIDSQRLSHGISVFGVPCFRKEWDVARVAGIVTSCESDDRPPDPTGLMELSLFGHQSLLWRFYGWLFPWIGGEYWLAVRLKSGKRTQVWQGNDPDHLRHNVTLLQRHCDASVERG